MNRDALGPVLVAVLAVVALGVGAASLDSPTETSGVAGRGGGSDAGVFEGSRFDFGQPPPLEATDGPSIPRIAFQALAIVLAVAFLVSLYRLRDELGYRDLAVVVAGSLLLAGLAGALLLGGRLFGDGRNTTNDSAGFFGSRRPALPGGGGGSVDEATRTVAIDPPTVVAVLALAALVGLLVLAWRGDDTTDANRESGPDATDAPGTVAELGHAAGRTADRIAAEGETTNEVYRAWREMTDQLDVANPQSSTPREFARAATDAGMERGDVDELTDLFRTVRYGGSRATDDRESRAVAALRNIEHEYAEES